MNKTCSSTFRSKLTGNKLENIGYTRQIAVTNGKTAHVLTTIAKVGEKILIHKDGILCKQSPSGEKSMDHNDSSYEWNYQGSMNTI